MPPNFPGPYEIEQTYTVDGIKHRYRVNFGSDNDYQPGDLYPAMTMKNRSGVEVNLQTYYEALFNAIRATYSTTLFTMDDLTIWKYTPLTFDRTFITSLSTPAVGQTATAYTPAHTSIYTFRTFEGGIAKLTLLETTSTSNAQITYAAANAQAQAIFDAFTDPDAGWLGRDTSFILAPLRLNLGQNEAIWRKRFRP